MTNCAWTSLIYLIKCCLADRGENIHSLDYLFPFLDLPSCFSLIYNQRVRHNLDILCNWAWYSIGALQSSQSLLWTSNLAGSQYQSPTFWTQFSVINLEFVFTSNKQMYRALWIKKNGAQCMYYTVITV